MVTSAPVGVPQAESPHKVAAGRPTWIAYALAAALISTLIVSLATFSALHERQRHRERASMVTENVAHLLDQNLSSDFDKIDLVLQSAVGYYRDHLEQGTLDPKKLEARLALLQSRVPELTGLRIADRDGIVRFGSGIPQDARVEISDRDYFVRLRDDPTASLVVSGPIISKISKQWAIAIVRRLNARDGSFAGVVYTSIGTDHFDWLLALSCLGPHGAITIRAMDGALVHRSTDGGKAPIGSTAVSPHLGDIIAARSEQGEYTAPTQLDGIERHNAYRKVLHYPFYVIVGAATDDTLGGWTSQFGTISGLALAAILATCLAAALLYRITCGLKANIIERQKVEALLQSSQDKLTRSEKHLNAAQQVASLGSWEMDMVTGETRCSDELYRIFGIEPGSISLSHDLFFQRLLHPDDVAKVSAVRTATLDQLSPHAIEYRILRQDGTIRHIQAQGQVERSETGQPVRMTGTLLDVTERYEIQHQLEALLVKQNAMLNNDLIGIMKSGDRMIIWCNPAFEHMLGYLPGELKGMPTRGGYPSDEAYRLFGEAAFPILTAGLSYRTQAEYVRKDGSKCWMDVNGILIDVKTRDALWFFVDITQSKQVERKLISSEENYRKLAENSSDWVWAVDINLNTTYTNENGSQILGLSRDEFLATNFANLVHPDDKPRFEKIFQQALASKTGWRNIRTRFLHKDGRCITLDSNASSLVDAAGDLTGFQGMDRDVSERDAMEVELFAAKASAEKANSDKSRFLAAASHDLRQPLSALSLYMSVLERRVSPDQAELVANLQDCVVSLSELLTDLLDVSKLDAAVVIPKLSVFSIDEVLEDLVSVHSAEASLKGLHLRFRSCGAIGRTDQILFRRLLGNLLANAIRYNDRGGVLIACRNHQGKLWVEVWDTGIGIAEDLFEVIFDEFKQLGDGAQTRGSGLGLAIVDKTAKLLGLTVRLRSRLGRGSMFAVELPKGRALDMDGPAPLQSPVRRLRIALVEDHVNLRNALVLALKDSGHDVVGASNGPELLERLGQHAPDIVISDYRLAAGENGYDVIKTVRDVFDLELPAFLITGDTDPTLIRSMADRGIAVHYKPLQMDTFQVFIRQATERRSS